MKAKSVLPPLCGGLVVCILVLHSPIVQNEVKAFWSSPSPSSSWPPDIPEECSASISSCGNDVIRLCGSEGSVCHCDKACVVYGDCCEDFESLCPATLEAGLEEYGHLVGRNVVCEDNSKAKFLADCPALNPSPHRDACLEGANNFRHDRFPVTDAKTGLSFLNTHCALCNGVVEDDLEPWDTAVFFLAVLSQQEIARMTEITNLPSTIQWVLNSSEESVREGMGWEWLPELSRFKRPCIPGAIDSCPSDDQALVSACSGSTSYVTGVNMNGSIFRNRHCLLCHGQTHCNLPVLDSDDSRFNTLTLIMEWGRAGQSQVSLVSHGAGTSWKRLTCLLLDGKLVKCNVQECYFVYDFVNGSCMENVLSVSLSLQLSLSPTPEWLRQSERRKLETSMLSGTTDALSARDAVEVTTHQLIANGQDPVVKNTSGPSLDNDSRVVSSSPDQAQSGTTDLDAILRKLPKKAVVDWSPMLTLLEQAALAAYPASQLVNSTVALDPEAYLVSLLAVNLTSRVASPFSGLNSTLSSLQPSLIAHLQTIGFHGNISLCINANLKMFKSDPCFQPLVVEVPDVAAEAWAGEGSPRPGGENSTPPSAHSAAWLPAVSGPGLVLAAVLALGTASLV